MSAREPRKGDRLPDEGQVFRAIRGRSWLHADTGKLQSVALLRRNEGDGISEEGVSVSGLAHGAVARLKRHYGAARLVVHAVRAATWERGEPLALDVVADPLVDDLLHALITGLPPWAPPGTADEQAQHEAADALIAAVGSHIINPRLEP